MTIPIPAGFTTSARVACRNAIPESVAHSEGAAGRIDLRTVPSSSSGMSPVEIWCNEAQRRYVLLDRCEGREAFRRAVSSASASALGIGRR